MARPVERNPKRTLSSVVQMWMEGKKDSEVLENMGWKTMDALYKYFNRNGFIVEDLRREAINKKKELTA
jgi:hypothetical protein